MRHFVLLTILFFLTFSLCEAAVIDPDLQALLQAGPSDQEIPVIVNLADRVDLNQIPIVPANNMPEGKALRRNAFAKALRDKADSTQGSLQGFLQDRGGKGMKSLWITNSIAVTVPASVINELISRPEIASIDLDAVVSAPPVIPAAAGLPQWNISRVNAPALWNAGITGAGSVVASLDTGVDVSHPDLQSRWRGGVCSSPPDCPSWFDPYNHTTVPYGIPAVPCQTPECLAVNNIHVHGTHVMGIMVGGSASPAGSAIGVAPGAKWISAKIFDDSGNSDTSTILSAFQWVLHPAGDGANAPDVVNNSWTAGLQNTCDTTFQAAISTLTAAGIEVVFSAGNVVLPPATASSSFSPGNNAGVFAVGATVDHDASIPPVPNTIATFSAWGPSACLDRPNFTNVVGINFPNLVAPGFSIYSSVPVGSIFSGTTVSNYAYYSGTSQSAPHVSGAAALLAGAIPSLTPAQIEDAFQHAALALPAGTTPPNNTYGYGLLDVAAAYQYAFTGINGNVARIASLPTSYNFGNIQISTPVSNTFLISNRGTADLQINPNPNGVSLSGPSVADFVITGDTCSGQVLHSLSSCSVTVQLSAPAVGPERATLSVASAQPTLAVPLSAAAFSVIHGGTPSSPAVAWDGTNNKLHVAVRGSNGNSIWVGSTGPSGAFNNDWTQVPGGTASAPAIAWNPTNQKLEIVVRGNSGNIFVGNANANGTGFSGWTQIPGGTPSAPAIAWNSTAQKVEIAVRGNAGNIFVGNASGGGTGFSGWTQIPSGSSPNTPAIAWNPVAQKLEICVRGNSGNLFVGSANADGTGFSGWTQIPSGSTPNTPAIAWDGISNKLRIAVGGSNGSSIWTGSISSSGVFNNDWTLLAGTSPSPPAIAFSSSSDKLYVLVREADSTIQEWATP